MVRRPRPEAGTEEREAFLKRWSRRKAAAAHGESEPTEPDASAEEPAVDPAPPPKTDADMPPVDSIDETSDVSEFFSNGVSEQLRQTALRKLFHLPKFNVVDGLDDYADDFTEFAALGDVITADMRHRMELERERILGRDDEVADLEQAEPGGTGEASEEQDDRVRPTSDDRAAVPNAAADEEAFAEDKERDDA